MPNPPLSSMFNFLQRNNTMIGFQGNSITGSELHTLEETKSHSQTMITESTLPLPSPPTKAKQKEDRTASRTVGCVKVHINSLYKLFFRHLQRERSC